MFPISRCFVLQLAFIFAFSALAEEKRDVLENLNYPELQVTPLASQRIIDEAKNERSDKWTTHWPIQASAVMTLVAAGQVKDKYQTGANADDIQRNKDAVKIGGLVGLGWIGTTLALSYYYTPYYDAYKATKRMPAGTKREQLAKERASESALKDADRFGAKLTWMSFATNLMASVNMAANTNDDGKVTAGLAVLLSATPLLFRYRWNTVAEEHDHYKKKIYGPVAQTTLIPVNQGKEWTPGVSVTYSF
ncbi:MAG: hypothetical protein KDD61_10895 [Bdellovibrionales bacterium]|nr:hypothetical protein [Bdellovibrionales bacterium]